MVVPIAEKNINNFMTTTSGGRGSFLEKAVKSKNLIEGNDNNSASLLGAVQVSKM